MSVGSFLGKIGRSLNSGITNYQRTRDFGEGGYEARQAYLNQFAAEQEAERELRRRHQELADQRQTAADQRQTAADKLHNLGVAAQGFESAFHETQPGEFFTDETLIDQQALALGLQPEDRALALGMARSSVTKRAQAEAKKRERGLKDLQEELGIRGGYERGLIGARSAADAANDARRDAAARANRGDAVDPIFALATREGLAGESPKDVLERYETFKAALAEQGRDASVAQRFRQTGDPLFELGARNPLALQLPQAPQAPGTGPMVMYGGRLVALASLPPDKQAKARAALGP